MGEIPASIKEFIGKYITSVSELEILLLVRDHSDSEWSASAVGKALELDSRVVCRRLDHLVSAGLIRARQGADELLYQYGPEGASTRGAVDQLAEAYPKFCVRIVGMIYSRTPTVPR